MKSFVYVIKHSAAVCLLAALCAGVAAAQTEERGRLRLDHLDRLSTQAAETVRVEIDNSLISFGCALLSDKDPEEREVKEVCAGLRGVYVRGLEFKSEGQYAESDVAALREQLRAPGWSRVLDIESRGLDFGDAEVYLATAAGRIEGFALLFVEPRELTVINIVGSLDLDKLRRLGDNLNLPRIRIKKKKEEK
jgi:Domain of unknown function (DUF4252)